MLTDILPVFAQMVVLFLILILGYIGGKTKYSKEDVSKYVSGELSSGNIGDLAANYMLALFEYHN